MLKNSLKVTLAYLAAVIGAGYASGSEAVYYFIRFGNISLLGIMLSAMGFGVFAYILLMACRRYKTFSFEELSQKVVSKKSALIINVLMTIFMLILLAAMISAFAEMVYLIFNVPRGLSAIIFCMLCYFVLLLPSDGLIKWGGIAGLFIVILICFCCVYMIENRTTKVFSHLVPMTFSASVYTAYNAFAVCPILCEWSNTLTTDRECKSVGVLSGILTFCASFLIWSLISIFYGKINLGDMPMLTIAARQGNLFMLLYAAVIFVSVLSSAVANAYGVYLKFNNRKTDKRIKFFIIMLCGWLISSAGFTTIVTDLYKYVGCSVLLIVIYISIKIKINSVLFSKIKKNKENITQI